LKLYHVPSVYGKRYGPNSTVMLLKFYNVHIMFLMIVTYKWHWSCATFYRVDS